MMRRCIALILALAVCMGIFSACINEDSYPPALELSSDVPPRQGEETLAQGEFEATLYYINEDGTSLRVKSAQCAARKVKAWRFAQCARLWTGRRASRSSGLYHTS